MTQAEQCQNLRRHVRFICDELDKFVPGCPEPERGALRLVLLDMTAAGRRLAAISEHLRVRQVQPQRGES